MVAGFQQPLNGLPAFLQIQDLVVSFQQLGQTLCPFHPLFVVAIQRFFIDGNSLTSFVHLADLF